MVGGTSSSPEPFNVLEREPEVIEFMGMELQEGYPLQYRDCAPADKKERVEKTQDLWNEPQIEPLDKVRQIGGTLTYLAFSSFILVVCMQVDHYIEIDFLKVER